MQLVKFVTWSAGYRAGDIAGFSPAEAARLIELKVAEACDAPSGKAAAADKAVPAAEDEPKQKRAGKQ